MRAVEFLQLLGPLALILAALRIVPERRLVRRLTSLGALDQDRAATIIPGSSLGAWHVRRLARTGVIRTAGDGRLWLDSVAWRRFRARRRKRALLAAALAVLLVLVALSLPR
jgi:hypothetical protein